MAIKTAKVPMLVEIFVDSLIYVYPYVNLDMTWEKSFRSVFIIVEDQATSPKNS